MEAPVAHTRDAGPDLEDNQGWVSPLKGGRGLWTWTRPRVTAEEVVVVVPPRWDGKYRNYAVLIPPRGAPSKLHPGHCFVDGKYVGWAVGHLGENGTFQPWPRGRGSRLVHTHVRVYSRCPDALFKAVATGIVAEQTKYRRWTTKYLVGEVLERVESCVREHHPHGDRASEELRDAPEDASATGGWLGDVYRLWGATLATLWERKGAALRELPPVDLRRSGGVNVRKLLPSPLPGPEGAPSSPPAPRPAWGKEEEDRPCFHWTAHEVACWRERVEEEVTEVWNEVVERKDRELRKEAL